MHDVVFTMKLLVLPGLDAKVLAIIGSACTVQGA
jgi:hypothetical protein